MRRSHVIGKLVFPLLVVLATAAASGCGGGGSPVGPSAASDLLRATVSDGAITLTNRTSSEVDYLLATPRFLELADPVPCAAPGACNTSVPANSSVTVALSAVHGYAPGERRAVVVHWRHPATTPENVRRITLRLD